MCLHAGAAVCSLARTEEKLHSSGCRGIIQQQPHIGSAMGTRLWVMELKKQRSKRNRRFKHYTSSAQKRSKEVVQDPVPETPWHWRSFRISGRSNQS